jgi:hypothetical protein
MEWPSLTHARAPFPLIMYYGLGLVALTRLCLVHSWVAAPFTKGNTEVVPPAYIMVCALVRPFTCWHIGQR